MRTVYTALWVAVAVLAIPSGASPQSISVRVVNADSGTPLVGALTELLSPAGRSIRRVLTDDRGVAVFPGLPAGSYAVRAEMIGMASAERTDVGLTVQSLTVDLRLEPRPVAISGLEVTADSRCTIRPAEGRMAALLWDEARKALEVAALGVEEDLYRYETMLYQRDLGPEARVVQRQVESRKEANMRSPFESLPPDTLAARGYVRSLDGLDNYYAPDAHALLSDVFLDTHCLRAHRSDGSEELQGLIGLGFEPVDDRAMIDIEGTLWLDLETSELRWLEYRYTNLPANHESEHVGGRVDFRRMPDGTWIIPEWWIRMPTITLYRDPDFRTREFVSGFRESGGIVLDARGRDDVSLPGAVGTIEGIAVDSVGYLYAGVEIEVVGAGRAAVSDADGTFSFSGLPEGLYQVTARHPELERYGASLVSTSVEVSRGGSRRIELFLPSATAILLERCGEVGPIPEARRTGAGVLFGWVHDEALQPRVGAIVTVDWTDSYSFQAVPSRRDRNRDRSDGRLPQFQTLVGESNLGYETATDEAGSFVLCSVPEGIPLTLTASLGDGAAEALDVTIPDLRGVVERWIVLPTRN